jgi:hypothetical protein
MPLYGTPTPPLMPQRPGTLWSGAWRLGGVPSGPDVTPPVFTGFSPADNATGIAITTDLVAFFNEVVTLGAAGLISLKRTSDNVVIQTWNVATQAGSGAGQVNVVGGNSLTMRLTAPLANSIEYYVIWDAGVVKDLANNNVAAQASTTLWSFTTASAADVTPPTAVSFNPLDNATGVALTADLIVTFSETVVLGTSGVISLKRTTDNVAIKTWDVVADAGSAAGKVEVLSGNQLTLHAGGTRVNSTEYYVIWDAGVVKDVAGNPVAVQASTTLWSFTTVAASGGTFLLDLYPTASMAYSFRKLRNAYAGSAVRIRRSSDNLELNIGFDGSGNFDTAAAAAHIGGGSGFIVTWFDQSGNAIDVTQATVANQPAYNATGVNAKPAVVYDGVNDNLGCAGVANTSMPAVTTTIMVVMQRTGSVTTNGTVVWANNVTSNVIELFAEYGSGILFDFGTNGARTWPAFPGNWTAMPHLVECGREAVGNFQYVTVDGNELVRQAQTAVLTAGTATFYVGDPATHQSGPISEVVVWAADLAANRAAARGNVQTYWQAGPLLLDGFGMAATKAYSLRKLNSAYVGSAIRIRRSSDNTEQDIGFVGVDLDTAAINTFVGANSAFVVTWYDQSGSGDNVTQATVALQARIMNAGVLDTRNGKPSALFAGTNKYAGTAATTIKAMGAVVAINLPGPNFTSYNCISSVATTSAFIQGNSGTPAYLTTGMGFPIVNGSGSNGVFGGTLQQLDGSGGGYSGAEVTLIGDDRNLNRNWLGWISEVVAFSISLGSGSRATLRADQKAYWGTPPYPLLLDHLGVSATRAYSTRKLRSAYAGSAIRIRRSSDNAELDIGFVGEDLDTAAVATFVGANSAFVVTWYDQSGSADDATQPTVANQARIVNAGTLDVRNGKACPLFDGSNDVYAAALAFTYQTASAIAAYNGTPVFSGFPGLCSAAATNQIFVGNSTTTAWVLPATGPSSILVNNVSNVATFGGTLMQVWGVRTSGVVSSTPPFLIGNDISLSRYWGGWIGEIVLFGSDLPSATDTALYDNQKTYWGTP